GGSCPYRHPKHRKDIQQCIPVGPARSSVGRHLPALRITTRSTRSSALDLPYHMATQVKPQAATVPEVFNFVLHLSASNRFFTRYAKISGPVAARNLLGHHDRQHSLLYQAANAHPQIVVPQL